MSTKKTVSKIKRPRVRTSKKKARKKPLTPDEKDEKVKHLKTGGYQWQPGQSGNPLGIKHSNKNIFSSRMLAISEQPCIKYRMFKGLAQAHGLDPKTTIVADILALVILGHVIDGKGDFAKIMFDRIEGKLTDKLEAKISGHISTSEAINKFITGAPSPEDEDDE